MKYGLKCGGTLKQRAERLFLLKDTPVEELDKSLFAKATKNKPSHNTWVKLSFLGKIGKLENVLPSGVPSLASTHFLFHPCQIVVFPPKWQNVCKKARCKIFNFFHWEMLFFLSHLFCKLTVPSVWFAKIRLSTEQSKTKFVNFSFYSISFVFYLQLMFVFELLLIFQIKGRTILEELHKLKRM